MEKNSKKWYLTWDGKNIFMIATLLVIPLITSVISTIHVIDFLGLANNNSMAITLAATFEAGLLAALTAMQVMRLLESKWAIYVIFILLTFYQLVGNIYYGYNYVTMNITENPYFINNFVELFQFVHDPEDVIGWKRIIAITAGAILPIISMIFLHINMEYVLAKRKKEEAPVQPEPDKNVEEEKKEIKNKKTDVIFEPVKNLEESQVEEKEYVDTSNSNVTSPVEPLLDIEPILEEVPVVLTKEEIEEAKQHHEDNKETIQDIKEELDKNVEEDLYTKLLTALYDNGKLQVGEKIPEYEEVLRRVKEYGINISDKDLKQFLVLCTVIKILDMNNRIVKKTFQQAKQIIDFLA